MPREVREKGKEGGKVSWPNVLHWLLGVPACDKNSVLKGDCRERGRLVTNLFHLCQS